MLDVVREVMAHKHKRRHVSAIRHFPQGCGRSAPPIDENLLREDANCNSSRHAPPSTGPEPGKSSSPETPVANGTIEPEVMKMSKQEPEEPDKIDTPEVNHRVEMSDSQRSMINGKTALLPVEISKPEPDELIGPSGFSQPEKAGKSSKGANHVEATDLSQTAVKSCAVKEEPKEVSDTGSIVMVENLDPSKESVILSNFLKNGGFDAAVSKLYGPSKRRVVSVIRHFPLGCGRNATSMTREECPRASVALHGKSGTSEEPTGKQRLAVVRADEHKGLKKLEELGDGLDMHAQESVVEYVGRESREEPASRTAPDQSVMEECMGKKSPAQEVGKNMQEGAQENCKNAGANPGFLDISNETIAEEEDKDTSVAPMGLESSSEGVQKIYRHNIVKCVTEVELDQVSRKEHSVKKALPRVDDKRVVKKSQSGKAQQHETPHLNAKTQPQLGKEVVKEATAPMAKFSEVKKSKDIKSHIWKQLEAEEEGNTESQGEELTSLDVHAGMMIVQVLLAAPNCPWRHGKHTDKMRRNASSSGNKAKKEVRTPKRKSLSLETSSVPGNKAKKEVRAPKRKRLSFESSLHQPLEKSEGGEDVLLEDGEDERALIPYHETEELSLSVPPFGPSDLGHDVGCNEEAAIRIRVRKALRLFQVVCRKLLQGEESRSKNRGQRIRVDLMAANILKEKNEFVNAGNPIIGSVPGVEVGDEFHYRAELCVVGLHRLFQGGIDFTTIDGTTLAICIVASVGHTDEMDSSDVLIYSGSGGSAAVGDQAPSDQKLQLGNLGLKNCIDAKTPVRVIRGIKELRCNDSQDGRSKPFSTFTYDGLYLVEEYWPEEGPQGFSIYKFKLRRIPGQPEIALKEIKKSKKSALREGLCIADISEGKEKIPISVVNTIDDERPTHFEYVIKMIYRSSYAQTPPNGCDCTKRCADSESCACAVKNGGEIPFNFNGAIVQAKPLVYECGPSCKCPPSCHNRVSQRGIKIRLEIFKTQSMGWGVRSLTSIPSGTFICEYIGELIPDKEAEQRSNDEYLFDIGHNYDDHDLWEGLPTLIPDLQSNSHGEVVEEAGFTIDAAKYGNVGRFINHSCSPNLYAQNVLYDHDDKRMPHIMLFAAENIPPLQELTYHYNYTIGQVRDSEGNMKTKDCHCGSLECTGRLY